MQISYDGLKALEGFEGFRKKAYQDSVGVWTIGFGTTRVNGVPVKEGDTCTEAEATLYLQADLAWAQTAVNQLVKVVLTQPMFDALTSFVYNIGESAFRQSTLLRLLNQGDYRGAANQFPVWKMAGKHIVPGLLSRRLVEQAMFTR